MERLASGSPASAAPGPELPPWWRDAALRADLARVEATMRAALDDGAGPAGGVLTHLLAAGGKRLRAAIALLAARGCGGGRAEAITAAAAVELMHLASLYHDDVVDQARQRRGLPSVNRRWGNQAATFAGGLLLARATGLFATLGREVNALAAAALARLWRGQMRELESVFQLDVDEQHRLAIAIDKTATLYELPCRVGALVAGAPAAIADDLAGYGRALGVAFQIVDDVLDIVAPATELGKAAGTDLREGVYTLPVVLTLSGRFPGGEALRAIVALRDAGDVAIERALAILAGNGAVEAAVRAARCHVDAAKAALARVEPAAAAALGAIAEFVLDQPALRRAAPC